MFFRNASICLPDYEYSVFKEVGVYHKDGGGTFFRKPVPNYRNIRWYEGHFILKKHAINSPETLAANSHNNTLFHKPEDSILKKDAIYSPEIMASNNHTTRCHKPEVYVLRNHWHSITRIPYDIRRQKVLSWRKTQYVPPTHWHPPTRVHDVKTKELLQWRWEQSLLPKRRYPITNQYSALTKKIMENKKLWEELTAYFPFILHRK
jgi:hypothetical protein